jgi:hypothetical protein
MDHRARQARWLCARRAWERENRIFSDDIRAAWPPDSADGAEIAVGTWIASIEQIAGSKLEYTVPISPTGRVLVFDIASDKELLMARISELIDRERDIAGIPQPTRRGPKAKGDRRLATIRRTEQSEFLRSIQDLQIVAFWDLQLAGRATGKLATARMLYPNLREKRSLLKKIRRAQKLQQEALFWIPRLRAVVGHR